LGNVFENPHGQKTRWAANEIISRLETNSAERETISNANGNLQTYPEKTQEAKKAAREASKNRLSRRLVK